MILEFQDNEKLRFLAKWGISSKNLAQIRNQGLKKHNLGQETKLRFWVLRICLSLTNSCHIQVKNWALCPVGLKSTALHVSIWRRCSNCVKFLKVLSRHFVFHFLMIYFPLKSDDLFKKTASPNHYWKDGQGHHCIWGL